MKLVLLNGKRSKARNFSFRCGHRDAKRPRMARESGYTDPANFPWTLKKKLYKDTFRSNPASLGVFKRGELLKLL